MCCFFTCVCLSLFLSVCLSVCLSVWLLVGLLKNYWSNLYEIDGMGEHNWTPPCKNQNETCLVLDHYAHNKTPTNHCNRSTFGQWANVWFLTSKLITKTANITTHKAVKYHMCQRSIFCQLYRNALGHFPFVNKQMCDMSGFGKCKLPLFYDLGHWWQERQEHSM